MTEPTTPERKRVALTIRLPHTEWTRVHKLALAEQISIQTLVIQALNHYLESKGQKPLKVETFDRLKSPED